MGEFQAGMYGVLLVGGIGSAPPPVAVEDKRKIAVSEGLLVRLRGLLAHEAPGVSDERVVEEL